MTQPAPKRFPAPAIDTLPDDIRARMLGGAGESRLRAERVPGAGASAGGVPRVLRVSRRADGEGRRPDQGRARDDRGRHLGANDCQYCVVAHGAILRIRAKNPLIADQVAVNYRKADITPRQTAMLDFAIKVAPRAQRCRRRRFRRAARPRLLRRRHLGHRRDRRVLRAVEPDGQHDRDAAERRVLPDGTAAEMRPPHGRVIRRRRRTTAVGSTGRSPYPCHVKSSANIFCETQRKRAK